MGINYKRNTHRINYFAKRFDYEGQKFKNMLLRGYAMYARTFHRLAD